LSGAGAKLASINLRKLVLSPTGSINLDFILREDLLLCSSYLPLGVPNWAVIYTPSRCCFQFSISRFGSRLTKKLDFDIPKIEKVLFMERKKMHVANDDIDVIFIFLSFF
jgi:hypothetical protein